MFLSTKQSVNTNGNAKPEHVLGGVSETATVVVGVRLKPTKDKSCIRSAQSGASAALSIASTGDTGPATFGYDICFPPQAETFAIWATIVRPCVTKLLKGINSAVFAYGGTGSGKSFTMGFESGGPLGMVQFAAEHIFTLLRENRSRICVYMTYMEIYGDAPTGSSDGAWITDLMSNTDKKVTGHDLTGLMSQITHVRVNDSAELLKAFNSANVKRQVDSHSFNSKSSRSHGVMQIALGKPDWISKPIKNSQFKGYGLTDGSKPWAKMNIIDLAGSEPAHLWRNKNDPVGMKKYREAVVINTGLGSLKACMQHMAGKAGSSSNKNNSMLTKVLGDLLEKNSKGYLRVICTVNPIYGDNNHVLQLSRGTLEYANDIKNIKIEAGVEKDLLSIQKELDGDKGLPPPPPTVKKVVPKQLEMFTALAAEGLNAPRPSSWVEKIPMNFGDKQIEIVDRIVRTDVDESIPRVKADIYTFSEGTTYEGEWRGSSRDGYGVACWPDGSRYEGEWFDDFAHGTGTFYHANGDVYEGDWKYDVTCGKGTYTHIEGAIYEGDFVEDTKHGIGEEKWPDGSVFKGEYKHGAKHGKGVFDWGGGQIYKGEFFNNAMHGHGEYVWSDGRKYEGNWSKGMMQGQGVMTWPDGRKYQGEYAQDQKHGHGEFRMPDGTTYIGQWKEGKQHGRGNLVSRNGRKEPGVWENGTKVK